jgi:hypothetical protein
MTNGSRRSAELERLWRGLGAAAFQAFRNHFLVRVGTGALIMPVLYVPAVIFDNRAFMAIVAVGWLLAQLANGVCIFLPEPDERRLRGAALAQAVVIQLVGIVPWLAFPLFLVSPSPLGMSVAFPVLALWGMGCVLISGGEGPGLLTRCRTSLYWVMALVVAGLFGFAAVIVALVLAIKALHPLA